MKKTLLATSVASLFAVASANALETGSFYLKPIVGYSIGEVKMDFAGTVETDPVSGTGVTTNINDKNKIKNAKGFKGGIAFGYNISEDLRTDLTIGYSKIKKDKIKQTNPTAGSTKQDIMTAGLNGTDFATTSYQAMVSGYYHFTPDSSFSPYVTAGLGVGRSEAKVTQPKTDTQAAADLMKSKKSTKAIYKVGVGFDVNIAKGIDFDLSYSLGNLPQIKGFAKNTNAALLYPNVTKDPNSTPPKDGATYDIKTAKTKANLVHGIEAGVRFSF